LLEPVNPLNFLFVDSLKRCHREPLWYPFDEDAFTPLALLNTPKLNLNQRKINENIFRKFFVQALHQCSTKLYRGARQAQIETLIELILQLGQIAIVVSQFSQQRP
jgi:hypothetical protein